MMTQRSRWLGIVLVILSIPGLTAAQQRDGDWLQQRRDGNWWREANATDAAGVVLYVAGLVDSLSVIAPGLVREGAALQAATQEPRALVDTTYAAPKLLAGAQYELAMRKFLVGVAISQVVDGVDAFYQDFRNRRVGIAQAVWIVLNQIAGANEATVNSLVEFSRQNPL